MYANDSRGNGFYQILKDGTFQLIKSSPRSSHNDGTNCPIKSIDIFIDKSDAPISYGEVSHNIDSNLKIGKYIDSDTDSVVSEDAQGDDNSNLDDEDAFQGSTPEITLPINDYDLDITLTNLKAGNSIFKRMDRFNRNGKFDQTEVSETVVVGNNSNLSLFTVHWTNLNNVETIVKEGTSFLRLRLSTDLNSLEVDQNSSLDGEVEDHPIMINGKSNIDDAINIERTNSNLSTTLRERQSLYTQIANKKFDYSLVFYKEDFKEEKKANIKTVAKIDIINKTNRIIATNYIYIDDMDETRFKGTITVSEATKDARFKVTFLKDSLNKIVNTTCNDVTQLQVCYNRLLSENPQTGFLTRESKDNFAIRPEYFKLDINMTSILKKLGQY